MTAGIFVGLDSGGTRTDGQIVAVGPDGREEERAFGSTASLAGALEPLHLAEVLKRVLQFLPGHLRAVNDNVSPNAELPVFLWVGCAAFTPWTRRHFEAALNTAPQQVGVAADVSGAANDGVSLLLGSESDGIVVAGTGSTVLIKSSDGPIKQTGGHEWVACDHGAGFWIGLQGIRAAYQDFEDRVDDSIVLARLREVYGIDENDDAALKSQLRQFAIASPGMKKNIAAFCRYVFDAAERDDEAARRIVNDAAASLGKLTAQAIARGIKIDKLNGPLKLAQCGSLFRSDFYRSRFQDVIRSELRPELYDRIRWEHYLTGKAACVALAQRLADPIDPIHALPSDEFEPVIVPR